MPSIEEEESIIPRPLAAITSASNPAIYFIKLEFPEPPIKAAAMALCPIERDKIVIG